MDSKTFNEILISRIGKIQDTLRKKGDEYVVGGDILHSFRAAANITNTTPERALRGMMMKHLVSVLDIIESEDITPIDVVDEKLGDLINYLILLEACLIDRIQTHAMVNEMFNKIKEEG